MSPASFREFGWLLMLIPFGIVLGVAGVFIRMARRRRWQNGLSSAAGRTFESSRGGASLLRPSLPEPPTRWLAIKTRHPRLALAALNLRHPMPCSMEEGLAEAREDKLFISPSMHGWTLVVGSCLPDPAEDVDVFYRFLTTLSRRLGHTQYFSVSRALNYHAWALVEKGRIFRGYAWAGETLWNQGPVTAAEKDLGMTCFDYCADVNAYSTRDALAANCEKAPQLAARWGIDPAALWTANWKGQGIVGELGHSKPH